jgi:site-specific recombinase XerD
METLPTALPHATLTELADQVQAYIRRGRAGNTQRAYQADWQDFSHWCEEKRQASLPATPETVALYLIARVERCKVSTLQRRLSAISQAHEAAGHETPTRTATVRAVWQGIRRTKRMAPTQKVPALTTDIRAMLDTRGDDLLGVRDRALLLVGFAGAFRRSELVGLDVEDLSFTPAGVVVTLRHSKTDQEGAGRKVGIPTGAHPETCPVRALQAWLKAAEITTGAIFRGMNRHGQLQSERLSDRGVARVVQRCAAAAGLDPTQYGGHSLRAGLATAAAAAGASESSIMKQTGHQSAAMVRCYIRDGTLFRDNAAASVGL